MDYNLQTKISEIIGHDAASIQAIADVAPPLKRLKNPLLRKIMASRVTVKEAARMGGCQPEDIIRVLDPLGYRYMASEDHEPDHPQDDTPGWLSEARSADIHTFDVRPIIENGTDPLKAIVTRFKVVGAGEILCVINSFVPTPLIHLLEGKQADQSFVKQMNDREFHTFFRKTTEFSAPENSPKTNVLMDDAITFQEVCGQFSSHQTKVIDVRHLAMPMPMQTILAELEELPEGWALYVHHKRVPVYLLEELADGGFDVRIHRIRDGNVKMLIFQRP